MSQPRPDASWSRERPGPSRSGSSRGTANPWSPEPPDVPGAGRSWGVGVAPSDPGPDGDWAPDAVERGPAAERDRAGERGAIALTGRGAVSGMLAVFFFSLLVASWLQWGALAGASFVIGSVAAAWYTKPRDLLTAVVSPPLLFFCTLICVKALTAKGSMVISTVEGTALTLANVAPWLFAGVVVYLIVAWVRGLPQSVAGLRRDLRPDLTQPRLGSPRATGGREGYRPASRRYR
ncbi:MAG TPA: DUF6542 domain-containing protein [Streptosporangiaceae bacterium]